MTMKTRRFVTTGMHCPSCSMLIQMDVSDLDGVTDVMSDHRTGLTEVVYDDDVTGPEAIIATIAKAGYGAALDSE